VESGNGETYLTLLSQIQRGKKGTTTSIPFTTLSLFSLPKSNLNRQIQHIHKSFSSLTHSFLIHSLFLSLSIYLLRSAVHGYCCSSCCRAIGSPLLRLRPPCQSHSGFSFPLFTSYISSLLFLSFSNVSKKVLFLKWEVPPMSRNFFLTHTRVFYWWSGRSISNISWLRNDNAHCLSHSFGNFPCYWLKS